MLLGVFFAHGFEFLIEADRGLRFLKVDMVKNSRWTVMGWAHLGMGVLFLLSDVNKGLLVIRLHQMKNWY